MVDSAPRRIPGSAVGAAGRVHRRQCRLQQEGYTIMELIFLHRRNVNQIGLAKRKVLTLPDVFTGVLAVEHEGGLLEIGHVFQGEFLMSWEVRDDEEELENALYEFEESFPARRF